MILVAKGRNDNFVQGVLFKLPPFSVLQEGAITSLEKGKTITVLCCMSAVGSMDQAPQGALGVATKNVG